MEIQVNNHIQAIYMYVTYYNTTDEQRSVGPNFDTNFRVHAGIILLGNLNSKQN